MLYHIGSYETLEEAKEVRLLAEELIFKPIQKAHERGEELIFPEDEVRNIIKSIK